MSSSVQVTGSQSVARGVVVVQVVRLADPVVAGAALHRHRLLFENVRGPEQVRPGLEVVGDVVEVVVVVVDERDLVDQRRHRQPLADGLALDDQLLAQFEVEHVPEPLGTLLDVGRVAVHVVDPAGADPAGDPLLGLVFQPRPGGLGDVGLLDVVEQFDRLLGGTVKADRLALAGFGAGLAPLDVVARRLDAVGVLGEVLGVLDAEGDVAHAGLLGLGEYERVLVEVAPAPHVHAVALAQFLLEADQVVVVLDGLLQVRAQQLHVSEGAHAHEVELLATVAYTFPRRSLRGNGPVAFGPIQLAPDRRPEARLGTSPTARRRLVSRPHPTAGRTRFDRDSAASAPTPRAIEQAPAPSNSVG
jgi:hypothetical protein